MVESNRSVKWPPFIHRISCLFQSRWTIYGLKMLKRELKSHRKLYKAKCIWPFNLWPEEERLKGPTPRDCNTVSRWIHTGTKGYLYWREGQKMSFSPHLATDILNHSRCMMLHDQTISLFRINVLGKRKSQSALINTCVKLQPLYILWKCVI